MIEGRLGFALCRIDKKKFSSLLSRLGKAESIHLGDPVRSDIGEMSVMA